MHSPHVGVLPVKSKQSTLIFSNPSKFRLKLKLKFKFKFRFWFEIYFTFHSKSYLSFQHSTLFFSFLKSSILNQDLRWYWSWNLKYNLSSPSVKQKSTLIVFLSSSTATASSLIIFKGRTLFPFNYCLYDKICKTGRDPFKSRSLKFKVGLNLLWARFIHEVGVWNILFVLAALWLCCWSNWIPTYLSTPSPLFALLCPTPRFHKIGLTTSTRWPSPAAKKTLKSVLSHKIGLTSIVLPVTALH